MRSGPELKQLHVQNYRVLRDVELRDLTPLTVFLGPNGSGKSTIFDVFAFLSECFTDGLRRACDKRNRLRELRSRGERGPVVVEVKYREGHGQRLITYRLAVDEDERGFPRVAEEMLRWTTAPGSGRPRDILRFEDGRGRVYDEQTGATTEEQLVGTDVLAVSTLGLLERHPRVAALRAFISGWYLSYLTAEETRTTPVSGPAERLSQTGDNLPNVVQYLSEQHPDRLERINETLRRRVPRLDGFEAQPLPDGRLMLRLRDQPFSEPILSRYASDGTLKLFAYLTVLFDPSPSSLIGIEEPENFLYPDLLPALATEAREAATNGQVLVTTHSPFFVNGLRPRELRILDRDPAGFCRVRRADEIALVPALMDNGAQLGWLWQEGYFDEPEVVRADI